MKSLSPEAGFFYFSAYGLIISNIAFMVYEWYFLFSQEKTIKIGKCNRKQVLKILNHFKRLLPKPI